MVDMTCRYDFACDVIALPDYQGILPPGVKVVVHQIDRPSAASANLLPFQLAQADSELRIGLRVEARCCELVPAPARSAHGIVLESDCITKTIVLLRALCTTDSAAVLLNPPVVSSLRPLPPAGGEDPVGIPESEQ